MRWLATVTLLSVAAVAGAQDPYDTESKLGTRWGYLVIDTIVGRPTANWRLSNGLTIDRLPVGHRTIMIRLPIGRYSWEQIDIPYFDLPHELDVSDDRRWAFTIERLRINYAGTLIVSETRSSDGVGVRFVNRSSGVLDRLRENYPEHLEDYGLVFSGSYRDDFLALVMNGDETRNSE